MNFEKKNINGTTVFKLNESRLDANISGLVKSEFTNIVKVESSKNLIIDLSGVDNCDSSGLSTLLVANRLTGAEGGKLRIVSPSKKLMTLIKITQLDKVLKISESIEIALEELNH